MADPDKKVVEFGSSEGEHGAPRTQPIEFGSSEGAPTGATGRRPLRGKLLDLDLAVRVLTRASIGILLLALFIGINYQVWQLINVAFASDVDLLRQKVIQPDQRLVTEKVLIALITATAVQVAAVIAAIVSNLFHGRVKKSDDAMSTGAD